MFLCSSICIKTTTFALRILLEAEDKASKSSGGAIIWKETEAKVTTLI